MATATVQIPATGTYRIDPSGSSVSFTTRHLFGLGVVRGTFGVLFGLTKKKGLAAPGRLAVIRWPGRPRG